jgi:hypothetical protein
VNRGPFLVALLVALAVRMKGGGKVRDEERPLLLEGADEPPPAYQPVGE